WLEHRDGVLSLNFTLPFERPVLAEAKELTFSISDPEFYIAFEFAKNNPVKFSDGAPGTCKATIRQQEADQSLSEALQRQFGAFAVTTSTVAAVDCDMP